MLDFHFDTAEVFIPDGTHMPAALARTTHVCIAAHHDDIEIMAAAPILECFRHKDKWFTGVVVSDGRGSPRSGIYENYSDEEMRLVRFEEQRKAAMIGEYAAQIMLDYPSEMIKDGKNSFSEGDIVSILRAAKPSVVYTHNLADKHDTHIGVALKVVAAIRNLPEHERPQKLYGCEVWRDLDWMMDEDKISFALSKHENLQVALLGVFDSQISGGKRYDLAAMARRRANATYFMPRGVDNQSLLSFGMDLSPLILDIEKEPLAYIKELLLRFVEDVEKRILRIS